MKQTISLSFFTFLTLALCTFCVSVKAEDPASASSLRADLAKAFSQLTLNGIEGLKDAMKNNERARNNGNTKDISLAKFRITDVQVPASSNNVSMSGSASTSSGVSGSSSSTSSIASSLGIKVWFELSNGTMVNPTRKKWDNKEKFYIHIQTSVPVYVSLYQNYPDSRPVSRQIYPDKKYPEGFKVLQPGQSTRLPVLFETDDDMRDEIMSLVVVRADWTGIQSGLSTPATSSVVNSEGKPTITAQVTSRGAGTMKCINDRFVTQKSISPADTQENVSGLDAQEAQSLAETVNEEVALAKMSTQDSDTISSRIPDDVCSYMFGAGNVGQWQLTIKK